MATGSITVEVIIRPWLKPAMLILSAIYKTTGLRPTDEQIVAICKKAIKLKARIGREVA